MDLPEFDLRDVDAVAFCPSCGSGYTAGPTRCADCDEVLLSRAEIQAMRAAADGAPGKSEEIASSFMPLAAEPEPADSVPEFDLSDPDAVAYCPACGSGFRAGLLRCADCDRDLVPRSWAEARASERAVEQETVDPYARVRLADVENPFKANLLGSILNEETIWFTTEPTGWAAIRFVVRSRDLEAARQILSDLDEMDDRAENR
jgi:hypothetical protein